MKIINALDHHFPDRKTSPQSRHLSMESQDSLVPLLKLTAFHVFKAGEMGEQFFPTEAVGTLPETP